MPRIGDSKQDKPVFVDFVQKLENVIMYGNDDQWYFENAATLEDWLLLETTIRAIILKKLMSGSL